MNDSKLSFLSGSQYLSGKNITAKLFKSQLLIYPSPIF